MLPGTAKTLTFFPPPRWVRVRVGVDAAVMLPAPQMDDPARDPEWHSQSSPDPGPTSQLGIDASAG